MQTANNQIEQSANALAFSAKLERLLIAGDLQGLSPDERVAYYNRVCDGLGLNPFTKPFEYIVLNGKLTLYATRSCTDQLRALHNVSITVKSSGVQGDAYVVAVEASMPNGRRDEEIAAVSIKNLQGEAYSNAVMKTFTKAKRRVTLSICGLGINDVCNPPMNATVETDFDSTVSEIAPPPEPQKALPEALPANVSLGNTIYISKVAIAEIKKTAKAIGWTEPEALHALENVFAVSKFPHLRSVDADTALTYFSNENNLEEYRFWNNASDSAPSTSSGRATTTNSASKSEDLLF